MVFSEESRDSRIDNKSASSSNGDRRRRRNPSPNAIFKTFHLLIYMVKKNGPLRQYLFTYYIIFIIFITLEV